MVESTKIFGRASDITEHSKPPFNFPGNKSYMRKTLSDVFEWLYSNCRKADGRFVVVDLFAGSLYVAHIAQKTLRRFSKPVDVFAQDHDGYIEQFTPITYRCLEEVRRFILDSEPDIQREQVLKSETAEGVLRILERYPDNIRRHVQSKLNCYACRGGLGTMRMRMSTVAPQIQTDIKTYIGGVNVLPKMDWKDVVHDISGAYDKSDTIIWVLDPPYHKHTSRLGYEENKDIPIDEIVNYIKDTRESDCDAMITFGYEYFNGEPLTYLCGLYLKSPALMQKVFRLEYMHLIYTSDKQFPQYPHIPEHAQNITSYMLKKHGSKLMCPPGTPDFK